MLPVDWRTLKLDNYTDIVKKPMDVSTVEVSYFNNFICPNAGKTFDEQVLVCWRVCGWIKLNLGELLSIQLTGEWNLQTGANNEKNYRWSNK